MVRSAVDERVMTKSVCNIQLFFLWEKLSLISPHFTRNDLDTLLHSDKSHCFQVSLCNRVTHRAPSTQGAYATAGDGACLRSLAGLPFGSTQQLMQIPKDAHPVSVIQHLSNNRSPCL